MTYLNWHMNVRSGEVNNNHYTRNEVEEAHDASCMNHYGLDRIIKYFLTCRATKFDNVHQDIK